MKFTISSSAPKPSYLSQYIPKSILKCYTMPQFIYFWSCFRPFKAWYNGVDSSGTRSVGGRVSKGDRDYLASKIYYRDYLASKIDHQNFNCKWKSRNSIYRIEFKPLDSRKKCSKSLLVPPFHTLNSSLSQVA